MPMRFKGSSVLFKNCNLFIDRPNTAVPKNAFNNLLNVQIELEFEICSLLVLWKVP